MSVTTTETQRAIIVKGNLHIQAHTKRITVVFVGRAMVDTHQNQLAKCPNSTSSLEVCWVHAGGPTRSWIPSARPDASSLSTKEKRTLAASAKQGRNTEDPRSKWLWKLLECPPNPLLGVHEP